MRTASRGPALTVLLGVVLIMGCEDTGWGCEMSPLDRDLDDAHKIYDGALVEISPEGFGFFERNFDGIMDALLPEGLEFGIPPEPGSCEGFSDQRLCNQNEPCPVYAEIKDVAVGREVPNHLRVTASMDVWSDDIPLCFRVSWITTDCDFEIHIEGKPVGADAFVEWDDVSHSLAFDIQVEEVELDADDFTIEGGWRCDMADWNWVKNQIANIANNEINETLTEEIEEQLDAYTCMPCDYYALGCEEGTGMNVHCDSETGFCTRGSGECVRAPLGFVGKIDASELLDDVGLPSTPFSVYAAIGQRQSPFGDPVISYQDGPLQLRGITGSLAEGESDCVPAPSTMPRTDPPPRVDFISESAGDNYHVAIGISDRFLNKTLYEVYRSGGLCIDIGSELSDMVSTGLLTTFLPSLGVLTENENAPMYVALRPKDRPEVHIGEGTYRMEGGERVLDEPLITVVMNDVHLDIYAFLEERFYRILTLDADIVLPLGLEINDENELIPIVGQLDEMVARLEVKNSEILAESPSVLEDIVPVMISFVEPMIAELLEPMPIPDIQGFRLKVAKKSGVVEHEEPGRFEHLGVFAYLELVGQSSPFTFAPPTVELHDVRQPVSSREDSGALGAPNQPSIVVAVGESSSGPVEWQYRINGGFWSPFQKASSLQLRSPKLELQGRHVLEVRTRLAGEPQTLERQPERFEILLDWAPPEARITVDPSTGIARVIATDAVTPVDALEYSFAVDGGAFGPYEGESAFELPLHTETLEVRVRDEAGNVAEVFWEEPAARLRGGRAPTDPDVSGGCSSGSGADAWYAVVLLIFGLALLGRLPRPVRARPH